MNGNAPNSSATGSHVLDVKNETPYALIEGWDSKASCAMTARSITSTASPATAHTPKKTMFPTVPRHGYAKRRTGSTEPEVVTSASMITGEVSTVRKYWSGTSAPIRQKVKLP